MISVVDPESVGANEKQCQRTMAFLAVLQPYDTQDSNLAANYITFTVEEFTHLAGSSFSVGYKF